MCSYPECPTPEEPTKSCSKCKKQKYCSKECQTKHWKVHKLHCKSPATSLPQKAQFKITETNHSRNTPIDNSEATLIGESIEAQLAEYDRSSTAEQEKYVTDADADIANSITLEDVVELGNESFTRGVEKDRSSFPQNHRNSVSRLGIMTGSKFCNKCNQHVSVISKCDTGGNHYHLM